VKIVVGSIGGFVLSACCASLPNVAPASAFIPPIRAGAAYNESTAVLHDASRSRDVPIRIYTPAGVTGRKPVVVFSHGIGEDRDSYAYLGRALAQNGFIAVHVTHAGTDKAVLRTGYWNLYRATKVRENWTSRPRDISFVLDQLSARDDVEMTRVAVAGHSAGAFTAFGLAGARDPDGESFRDERVRAIVAMSMPRIEGVHYEDVRIPVLNMTGTCDSSLIYRTRQSDRRIPFERARGLHQYLVTIEGVNHNTFSNKSDPHHETIVTLTVNFLRAFLLDDRSARAWFDEVGMTSAGEDRVAVERK
jgi:predicted dienelactone hydrolase